MPPFRVPKIEVETHKVGSPDVVVPTLDTVRHESLLYTWLAEHKPMVLCGPPGSGKTMTLFSALCALPDFDCQCLHILFICNTCTCTICTCTCIYECTVHVQCIRFYTCIFLHVHVCEFVKMSLLS